MIKRENEKEGKIMKREKIKERETLKRGKKGGKIL
jgi:hypothetical protein